MNFHEDTFEGGWKEFKGYAQAAWGKLTDDDLEMAKGGVHALEGKLQKEYGMTIEKARDEIDALIDRYDNMASDGEWKEIKGKIQETWGDLTDDEVEKTAGKKSQLAGVLAQRYGHSHSKAWEEINKFVEKNF